jgi:integral membrane protein (TIGR00529 family)
MLEAVVQIPACIKVGACFGGILLVCRLGMALEWAMILFAVLLTLWSGAGVHGLVLQQVAFIQPESLLLIVVIAMLLLFSELLAKSKRMERTINALKSYIANDVLLLSGLPAIVGLLPMPGGALVSAPLVDSVDSNKNLTPSHKAGINYWFRHVWEYWWPLYPGVILAMTISGLTPAVYFLTMLPVTASALAGGYFFTLRKIKNTHAAPEKRVLNRPDILQTLIPVLILVACAMAGPRFLLPVAASKSHASLIAMVIGLVSAMAYIVRTDVGLLTASLKVIAEKKSISLMLAVAGVQLFATVLKIPLDATGQTSFDHA